MRKYFKNKKIAALSVSILVTTLILTGTFAWSVIQTSTTGGLGVDYNYLVKLLDIDTDPLFAINNWKSGALDKKVYATSSYNVEDIEEQYNEIIDDRPDSIFSDTWVRIKLEEIFMRNGSTSTTTVTEMIGDTLKSSVSDGKYFSFDKQATITTIDDWNGEQGRFWILDTDSGWLYWAQPLLATTVVNVDHPELADQTTDHIINKVDLKVQPAGVWEYTIKATLEAMDVELQGYKDEGVWNDIEETHDIYPLFDDVVVVDPTNFPDETFRIWITNNIAGAENNILTSSEIESITSLDISNQGIKDIAGIEYFIQLQSLNVSGNQLDYIDVTALTKLNKNDEQAFIYNPQYRVDGITPLVQINDSENIKEWHVPQFDELGNLLVNVHNFPDSVLLEYITSETNGGVYDNYDSSYASDGVLSPSELSSTTRMTLCDLNITDLQGIEHFQDLEYLLICRMPSLKKATLTNNSSLIHLSVHDNPELTDVNIDKIVSLERLYVYNSPQLETLDVSKNVALKIISAYNSGLLELKLGEHDSIMDLMIYGNYLKEIDISGLPSIFIDELKSTKNYQINPQYPIGESKIPVNEKVSIFTTDKIIW